MTHLRKLMLEELQRRNYSPTTVTGYLKTVTDFAKYFQRFQALGANRQSIYSLTVGEATFPVLAGITTGWLASLGAGRFISSLLYQVKPSDPLVTISVVSLFIVSAVLAAYLPARRAASIDPMEALRTE